uniref:Uncharacterized protein n=1 Tax=Romanomermis culicivorax TaxID=13658 RepID=A0A915HWP3_ROMCU
MEHEKKASQVTFPFCSSVERREVGGNIRLRPGTNLYLALNGFDIFQEILGFFPVFPVQLKIPGLFPVAMNPVEIHGHRIIDIYKSLLNTLPPKRQPQTEIHHSTTS